MKVISYRAAHGRSASASTVCRLTCFVVLLFVTGHAGSDAASDTSAETYWSTPVPHQAPAPPAPETCAACHADKYAQWSGSRHSLAFSPGLLGQIINYYTDDASDCLNCHAPLAEQQDILQRDDLETLAADIVAGRTANLAQHGVFCAACHLRDGVLHAPSASGIDTATRFHKNAVSEPLLGDSRFCASCHQFDADTAEDGKPLQNTYREWLESPYPEKGIGCQQCHMPDRAHLFRGIHDPETVRQGLTVETHQTGSSIELIVRSTNVGHDFPTYIVPRITLRATPLDDDGQPIADAQQERFIQRRMSFESGDWVELYDNRLKPGESAVLSVPLQQAGHSISAVNFRIIVEPEWFYHSRVYPRVLEELEDGVAMTLIKQAKQESKATAYQLYDNTVVTRYQP